MYNRTSALAIDPIDAERNVCKRRLAQFCRIGKERQTVTRLSILTLVFLCVAFAQSTAVISGTVEDSSGGLVPGASVIAIQQQTDQRFAAVSDSQGRFSFPRLPVGNYKIEVSRTGFRRFESEAIRLDADQTRQANVLLQSARRANPCRFPAQSR